MGIVLLCHRSRILLSELKMQLKQETRITARFLACFLLTLLSGCQMNSTEKHDRKKIMTGNLRFSFLFFTFSAKLTRSIILKQI